MFFTILKVSCTSAFITYGLHKYLVWNHSHEYDNFRFSCGYFAIYYFTKAQMLCMNIYSYMMEMIDPILKSDFFIDHFPEIKETVDLYEFIKEGDIFDFCPYKELINRSDYPKEFDFIIYSKIDKKDVYNNKIYSYIPTKIDEIIKTNYQFMLCEITIKDETFKIDLATNKHNYYIVDNVIDKHFIIYFLKRFLPCIFERCEMEDIEDYRFKIIDQNIVMKEMDQHSKLIFCLDNYEIIEDYEDLPDLISIDSSDDYTVLSDDCFNILEEEYSDISYAIRNSLEDQYTVSHEEEKQVLLQEEKEVLLEEEEVLLEAEKEVLLETEKEVLLEAEEQVFLEAEEQVLLEAEEQVFLEAEEQVLLEEEKQVLLEEEKQVLLEEEKEVLTEEEKQVLLEEEKQVLPEDVDIKIEEEYPDLSDSIPQIIQDNDSSRILADKPIKNEDNEYDDLAVLISKDESRVSPDPITSENDYINL